MLLGVKSFGMSFTLGLSVNGALDGIRGFNKIVIHLKPNVNVNVSLSGVSTYDGLVGHLSSWKLGQETITAGR